MSDNRNDESTAIIMVFAFIGAAFYIWVFVLALLAAFAAFVFTILSLIAWNKPLRLGRTFVITSDEARAFVYRGLIGAGVLPAFLLFVDIIAGTLITAHIPLLPTVLVGYTLGSVGGEIMMANGGDQDAGDVEIIPPQQQLPPPQAPAPQRLPFRFASWDDEEARR